MMVSVLLLTLCTVLVLDQATKAVVIRRLAEVPSVFLPTKICLTCEMGSQAAIFKMSLPVCVFIWTVAMLSGLALSAWNPLGQTVDAAVGLGLALGGAAGNLLDRLRWNAVVDFIDLSIWPVFNLADVAIVVGLGFWSWTLV